MIIILFCVILMCRVACVSPLLCRGQKTAPECHSLSTMGARAPVLVLRLKGKHCYLPSGLSSLRGSGYKILSFACGDNLVSFFSNIDVLYLFFLSNCFGENFQCSV